MVGGWRERLVEHYTFQNQNPVRVFLYHCISDGNQLFSENVGCHFHFILHIMSDKAAFVSGALFCVQCYQGNLALSRSNSGSCWQRIHLPSKTPSMLLANHNALGQLTNHNTFRFSEGGPSSNPELIKSFVPGWGERYCNNVNYVKNNAIFEPPSMRACSSTPPKQNQDFVKEHTRTPLRVKGIVHPKKTKTNKQKNLEDSLKMVLDHIGIHFMDKNS